MFDLEAGLVSVGFSNCDGDGDFSARDELERLAKQSKIYDSRGNTAASVCQYLARETEGRIR